MPEVATRPENARELTAEPEELPLAVRSTESVEPVPAGSVAPPALPCANCGTPLTGPYCSQCGQHAKDYHRSIWRFFHDFLDNTFCWDNKFLLTVKPLVRRPGFLTEEFMAGRRVRYVHPLRLFLFTSAVCLALIGFINHHSQSGSGLFHVQVDPTRKHPHRHVRVSVNGDERKAEKIEKVTDGQETNADEDDATKTTPAANAAPVPDGQAGAVPAPRDESLAAKIQGILADSVRKNAGNTENGPPTASPGATPGAAVSPVGVEPTAGDTHTRAGTVRQVRQRLRNSGMLPARRSVEDGAQDDASKPNVLDADAINAKIDAALAKGDAAMARGDAAIANADKLRAKRIGEIVGKSFDSEKAGRIVEEISQGVERKLSWVSLALLPVFALLMRAVYWREDAYYFTHFVYSLHYHTFLFLFWAAYACAGVVAAFLPLTGLWNFLLGWCILLPGWYLFVSLRRMYGESRRRTAAKVVVLGALHLVAILIGVASVGALAFFSAQR